MTNEILGKVKKALGITGDDQDDTINVYIDGIKEFMLSAGVPKKVVNNEKSYGGIVAGVMDTWNYGSGEIKLSPYTKERLIQLKYTVLDKSTDS